LPASLTKPRRPRQSRGWRRSCKSYCGAVLGRGRESRIRSAYFFSYFGHATDPCRRAHAVPLVLFRAAWMSTCHPLLLVPHSVFCHFPAAGPKKNVRRCGADFFGSCWSKKARATPEPARPSRESSSNCKGSARRTGGRGELRGGGGGGGRMNARHRRRDLEPAARWGCDHFNPQERQPVPAYLAELWVARSDANRTQCGQTAPRKHRAGGGAAPVPTGPPPRVASGLPRGRGEPLASVRK
jgi:hypothetical protein